MTFPDDSRDEPGKGPPDGQTEPELPFDEEAAWRAIVENYGERPELGSHLSDPTVGPSLDPPVDPTGDLTGDLTGDPTGDLTGDPTGDPDPVAPAGPLDRGAPGVDSPFDRRYLDALEAEAAENARAQEAWAEEGHFVPPEPPPVPRTTPARRLAWIGLFGAPVMMLLAVIAHLSYPTWVAIGLVAAFVGGFVFLVATMDRPGGDGWGGDDGAVV